MLYLQCDYDYLSFILMDSPSYRHFCRLEPTRMPRKPSLQSLVSKITAFTRERIARADLMLAKAEKIETGRVVAIDSTVTATDIKTPYDNDLIACSIKEMCRLLEQGQKLTPEPFSARHWLYRLTWTLSNSLRMADLLWGVYAVLAGQAAVIQCVVFGARTGYLWGSVLALVFGEHRGILDSGAL